MPTLPGFSGGLGSSFHWQAAERVFRPQKTSMFPTVSSSSQYKSPGHRTSPPRLFPGCLPLPKVLCVFVSQDRLSQENILFVSADLPPQL